MSTRTHRLALLTGLALAAVIALGGCYFDDGPSDAAPPASGYDVDVRGASLSYNPEYLAVPRGATVTWHWTASGHSVTSGPFVAGIPGCTHDGVFDSGVLNTGATWSRTFNTAGLYSYHCSVPGHCAGFESAVIEVQ